MNLSDTAATALEAVRRSGRNVRFEVRKACEQERWRLKVVYEGQDRDAGEWRTIEVGLLWSDDLQAVDELRDRLAKGASGRVETERSPARPLEEPPG